MTGKPENFRQALEVFEDLESRLGLPAWIVNGVHVWKILRFSMFSEYRQHLGLMHAAHPETDRLRKSKVRMIWDFPKPFMFRNPFFLAGHGVDRVVIPHARKRRHDSRLVDPISYPAWHPPYEETTVVLDKTNPLNPTLLPGSPSFEVLARLAWIRRQAVRVRLDPQDRRIIKELSQRLFDDANASTLESQVRKAVKGFIGLRSVFTALLKRTRPSHLYVVVSYGCEPLIASARDLGIETVEFQHGSIGRGHLAYDFKDWPNVPYFPDRMLAFGTDWFRSVHFPKSCTTDPIGYAPLEDAIVEASGRIDRQSKQILVLSQGPIADQVLAHASRFAAHRPDWKVVIRPHPSESAEHLRQQMTTIAVTDNWRVEKEPSLQEHTAASAVVFGVNSTALVEALLAGCRVAILDADNSAGYFDSLAMDGHASKVKDGEELADVVDDLPVGSARGYFAEPVDDIVAHVEG